MELWEIYLIIYFLLPMVLFGLAIGLLVRYLSLQKGNAFVQTLSQLEGMLNQIPQSGYGQLHTTQQDQIMQMLLRVNTQFNQLNTIAKQGHDLQVSKLMGMAANAGISWTPPS